MAIDLTKHSAITEEGTIQLVREGTAPVVAPKAQVGSWAATLTPWIHGGARSKQRSTTIQVSAQAQSEITVQISRRPPQVVGMYRTEDMGEVGVEADMRGEAVVRLVVVGDNGGRSLI